MKHPSITLGIAIALAGCTSLGPMPTTTGISAVPAGRPGGEVQAGTMPGYRLSSAASGKDRSTTIPQLAALFDPDRLLGIPGLFVGGRAFGEEGSDAGIEPLVGYRRRAGAHSFAVVGFGTRMGDAQNGASYEATRVGAEIAGDVEVIELASWVALHVQGAVSTTFVDASGTYCADFDGNGRDCNETPTPRMIDGELRGLYSAATASFSLDFARHAQSAFHSARLAFMLAAGHMPRLIGGAQRTGDAYASAGLSLTLGFGAAD